MQHVNRVRSRAHLESMTHFLYRHYDNHGGLLYIGITKDIEARSKEHKTNRTWWFEKVAYTEMLIFPTQSEAAKAERVEIRNREPLCNAQIHFMDTSDWPKEKFIKHANALALARFRNSVYERSGLGMLHASYKRNFKRDLFEDLGEVPIGHRSSHPNLDLSPGVMTIEPAKLPMSSSHYQF